MKAVQYTAFGTPDVLRWQDTDDPIPDAGRVIVRLEAAGLNYADVYRREGRFTPAGPAPWIPGMEGAGTIADPGPAGAAAGFAAGRRVAWCDNPNSNAERVAVEIGRLIPLPETVTARTAASVLLQGLTAHYLVHDSHPVRPGDWCVVHAAGGGVGLLLTQMIKRRGGRVIGVASTAEKQQAALDAGADAAIGRTGWVERVRAIARHGADVVFDSVGTTILESLAATRDRGRVVYFGMAGGEPPAVPPSLLMDRSLTLTGGDLWNVLTTPVERRKRAAELFSWIADGTVRPRIARVFALADVAEAHRYLESRAAIGKVLLVP
ncbi:quinone oxidoreductase [Actinoplanes sp. NPDC023714]|uniref:quinone oxidoreductase family protein n=1 Tax=Actinoplanes sp. NPDC023714 TaxID=3154322 RepID=UPI0033D3056A